MKKIFSLLAVSAFALLFSLAMEPTDASAAPEGAPAMKQNRPVPPTSGHVGQPPRDSHFGAGDGKAPRPGMEKREPPRDGSFGHGDRKGPRPGMDKNKPPRDGRFGHGDRKAPRPGMDKKEPPRDQKAPR